MRVRLSTGVAFTREPSRVMIHSTEEAQASTRRVGRQVEVLDMHLKKVSMYFGLLSGSLVKVVVAVGSNVSGRK